MPNSSWYSKLIKPSWAPPAYLFGPVWSVLYIVIIISFGNVFIKWINGDFGFLVAIPFILNLIFNFSFTPIQFKMRNNKLASVDIILVFITLIWAMLVIYPEVKWIVYAQIPYALWVGFASVLQLNITYLNRNK